MFAADSLMSSLAPQPCSISCSPLFTTHWYLESNYLFLSSECLQAPCFAASHNWLLLKSVLYPSTGVSSICYQHGITLSCQAASYQGAGTLCCASSHLPADPLSTSCPSETGTWLSVGPKPPQHMDVSCSKCVQQWQCFCKTGAGFSHKKGSATFGHEALFLNPCGLSYTLIYVSVIPFCISAMTKACLSFFSHLYKRLYLQNLFLYLVIFFFFFFPNENIKPDC